VSGTSYSETPMQDIIGADRLYPADLIQARRTNTISLAEHVIEKHPHNQSSGVPTACHQSPKDRVFCALRVNVEILRVKLFGKGDNLLRCHDQRAKIECVTDVEILKIVHMLYRVLFIVGNSSSRQSAWNAFCYLIATPWFTSAFLYDMLRPI